MNQQHIVLAMTGASGAAYAARLLDLLVAAGSHVHLSISPAAALVVRQELGLTIDLEKFDSQILLPSRGGADRGSELFRALVDNPRAAGDTRSTNDPRTADSVSRRESTTSAAAESGRRGTIEYHHYQNLMAPIASGSFLTAGMVICPCSGGTLGAVVHGTGDSLIHRAATVHLKERRKLILVPRETPLSLIQLENMRRAAEAGAVVLPAMPGFYHGATSIRDLVDFVVARICDQLGLTNELIHRWGT